MGISPMGIDNPSGSGSVVRLVGNFGAVKTPADLPPDGFFPINWDGPGVPSRDVQLNLGDSLTYQPANAADPLYGHLYAFNGDTFVPGGWSDVGDIVGPEGPAGAPGPAGPGRANGHFEFLPENLGPIGISRKFMGDIAFYPPSGNRQIGITCQFTLNNPPANDFWVEAEVFGQLQRRMARNGGYTGFLFRWVQLVANVGSGGITPQLYISANETLNWIGDGGAIPERRSWWYVEDLGPY